MTLETPKVHLRHTGEKSAERTPLIDMTKQRLYGALISYALLAGVALIVLKGQFLLFVLLLFVLLAFKSWVAYKKENL